MARLVLASDRRRLRPHAERPRFRAVRALLGPRAAMASVLTSSLRVSPVAVIGDRNPRVPAVPSEDDINLVCFRGDAVVYKICDRRLSAVAQRPERLDRARWLTSPSVSE